MPRRLSMLPVCFALFLLPGCSQKEAPQKAGVEGSTPDSSPGPGGAPAATPPATNSSGGAGAPSPTPSPAAPAGGIGAAQPATAKLTDGNPVGVYFMTRYWSGNLEKAAWYFTADGKVYQNLEAGFGAADLAAHAGPHGTFKRAGNDMEVTWSDGKKSKSPMELDKASPDCFMWDMGSFTPVKPFEKAADAAGSFEGGESLSHAGNRVMVSKKLDLRADGTFTWEGVSFVSGETGQSKLEGGATGATTGTWKLEGFTLTLDGGGKSVRRIAFPFDDDATPIKPDWMFFGGLLYKKK
ncbi:MAG: hypothetical protein HY291_00120 [Planctomycetes bacterium]|nr:hypothetical protein [Planctomycetota bacterium]